MSWFKSKDRFEDWCGRKQGEFHEDHNREGEHECRIGDDHFKYTEKPMGDNLLTHTVGGRTLHKSGAVEITAPAKQVHTDDLRILFPQDDMYVNTVIPDP